MQQREEKLSYYFKPCQIQNRGPEKKKMPLETAKGKEFGNIFPVLDSTLYYTALHWPFLEQ